MGGGGVPLPKTPPQGLGLLCLHSAWCRHRMQPLPQHTQLSPAVPGLPPSLSMGLSCLAASPNAYSSSLHPPPLRCPPHPLERLLTRASLWVAGWRLAL